MPERDVLLHVHLDVAAGGSPRAAHHQSDTPFHVALLGDFGARTDAGSGRAREQPPSRARSFRVDRDDLDAAMAHFAPELVLEPGTGESLRIPLTSLCDFHPDRLVARLPVFTALRDLRARLTDPRTSAATAASITHAATNPARPVAPSPEPRPSAAAPTAARDRAARAVDDLIPTGNLLDDVVATTSRGTTSRSSGSRAGGDPSAGDGLADVLREIVRPHLVPSPDPRLAELTAAIDAATTALLRSILSHPRFRALEALWRGVEMLTRRVETGPSLRLVLLDITPDELSESVPAHPDDPRTSPLYKSLADAAATLPEHAPWSLLVDMQPPAASANVPLLHGLARVAVACGAPWITAAPRDLAPMSAVPPDRPPTDYLPPDGWPALREAPHSNWLGMAHPPVLLRLPYGEDGDPCDDMDFEELEPDVPTDQAMRMLLWGSPALVPAIAVCTAFTRHGWSMRPEAEPEVDRLPLYLHREAGTVVAIPPIRWSLGGREVEWLLEQGVMALVPAGGGGDVRVSRLMSVAKGEGRLSGRWSVDVR